MSILIGSQRANLISEDQSFTDSYKILQFSSSSAAAEAVQKLAQRFAAGSGELAELVRKDQDLTVEAGRLDKALIAAVSKAPNSEPLSGLAPAFLYAGGRSLVVSYSLSLLDAAQSDVEVHPRVWAPFVVVGEPAARVHQELTRQ